MSTMDSVVAKNLHSSVRSLPSLKAEIVELCQMGDRQVRQVRRDVPYDARRGNQSPEPRCKAPLSSTS
jgi:hypothetical protein